MDIDQGVKNLHIMDTLQPKPTVLIGPILAVYLVNKSRNAPHATLADGRKSVKCSRVR
jgi:hypothetical protein